MHMPSERLRLLEVLAEELMKDNPQDHVVGDYMRAAGLVDSKDPIDRINKVLTALQFELAEKEIKE